MLTLIVLATVAATQVGEPVIAFVDRGVDTARASLDSATSPRRDAVPERRSRDAADVYSGRSGRLAVHLHRIQADIPVLGTLTDPVWEQAAVLTGFSEYAPIDGAPAEDSTEVLVWYSPRAIYFGVRAFEPHGGVHYKLADRDKIDAGDNIQIFLSPFVHSRQSLVFAVNPLGVQEDGTITEGVSVTTRRFNTGNTQTGRPTTDLSPDFLYESKGHVTTFGYEVVVRIPFRSIKYQSADPQDWGSTFCAKSNTQGTSRPGCRRNSPPRRSWRSRARSSA